MVIAMICISPLYLFTIYQKLIYEINFVIPELTVLLGPIPLPVGEQIKGSSQRKSSPHVALLLQHAGHFEPITLDFTKNKNRNYS